MVGGSQKKGDVMSASSPSLPDTLRVYGNLSLLEMAPVLLAAELYPGKTLLEHGSVMALWGRSSDLASLNSAGQADVATNSETQALRASVDNPDLRFIFTVAECPYRIVARRSAGVSGLADLRGKRVGTQLESSAAYFLEVMLRTAGLTSEDVVCVPFMAHTEAPISHLPEALRSGRLDAVALWEPQVQRAKLAIGSDAVEFRDPAVYTEKFNLCTTQAHLDNAPLRKRIVVFVRALIAAARRLKQKPEAGWRLVSQAAKLDIETVESAWPYLDYPATLATDLLDIFERQEVWIAKTQGRAPRTRDALSKLIDDSVLREALS
ncbi:MAG: ABC transporter substrate-binding protein [Betaproteobacteria bacterium]|nr:MAG: ABC transporter substrate-binding protein [Betaproteobacteria bacterium]